MKNNRQLAIKNLKGSEEKMRVSWMLKNMREIKTFKYLSRNNHLNNKKELLKFLKQRYTNYRDQWRGNPKFYFNRWYTLIYWRTELVIYRNFWHRMGRI